MSASLLLEASGQKGGSIRLKVSINLSWLNWFWGN